MTKELETLLSEFQTLGENYCANVRTVLGESEATKMVDIYEAGLRKSMAGVSELFMAKYNGELKEERASHDRMTAMSGGLEMLEAANKVVGGASIKDRSVLIAAKRIIEKVKLFLRLEFLVRPGEQADLILRLVDDFFDNITELLSEENRPRPPVEPHLPPEHPIPPSD